ncbi:hypothetical protein F750_3590 [Streptomyces sp. PAMC 26508]|nr:hypothetical protein F750_3590 [Streptomyces sp. PAMC 26508]
MCGGGRGTGKEAGDQRRPDDQGGCAPEPPAGRGGIHPLKVCRLGHAYPSLVVVSWYWSCRSLRPRMVTMCPTPECRGPCHMIGRVSQGHRKR